MEGDHVVAATPSHTASAYFGKVRGAASKASAGTLRASTIRRLQDYQETGSGCFAATPSRTAWIVSGETPRLHLSFILD